MAEIRISWEVYDVFSVDSVHYITILTFQITDHIKT